MTDRISRREFLKLSGLSSLVALMPPKLVTGIAEVVADVVAKKSKIVFSRAGMYMINAKVFIPSAEKSLLKILKNGDPIASYYGPKEANEHNIALIHYFDPDKDSAEIQVYHNSGGIREIPEASSIVTVQHMGDYYSGQVLTNKSKQKVQDQTLTLIEFDSSLYDG